MKINKWYKKIGSYLFLCGILLVIIGTSYAFYQETYYTNSINFSGASVSIAFDSLNSSDNSVLLSNSFPMSDIEALTDATYIDFSLIGINTSEYDLVYTLSLQNGEDVDGYFRFDDSIIKISLLEDNTKVVDSQLLSSFTNRVIRTNQIDSSTSTQTTIDYRLYLWIDDSVEIGLTGDFTAEEFSQRYCNFKIVLDGYMD